MSIQNDHTVLFKDMAFLESRVLQYSTIFLVKCQTFLLIFFHNFTTKKFDNILYFT